MAFRDMRGFSMPELLIVVAIIGIMIAVILMSVAPAQKDARLTNAYETALTAMLGARGQAVSEARIYMVSFTLPGTITTTRVADGTVTTSTLTTDVAFDTEPGIPNSPTAAPTTPDGFGSGSITGPIVFDLGAPSTTNSVYFYPDGTARDSIGRINNGIVYLARPGDLLSSRAITVWGLTGRIRGWRLYKNTALYWSQQ